MFSSVGSGTLAGIRINLVRSSGDGNRLSTHTHPHLSVGDRVKSG